MSIASGARTAPRSAAVTARADAPQLVLLGAGRVGAALLQRLARAAPRPDAVAVLRLVGVADSRRWLRAGDAGTRGAALAPDHALARLAEARERGAGAAALVDALGRHGTRIVVDASASDALAQCHAEWLADGIHVVTASKLGAGASLARWRAIRAAAAASGACYGDSATVGAGLPLLRAVRRLARSGERVGALAGTLSGSLAWLLGQHDGRRPFSALLREAHARGYTEPDPREDLCGADVRRKLLILARNAGCELDDSAVEVESLVPPALARLPARTAAHALELLDAPLQARLAEARRDGRRLRWVARLAQGQARVGLEALAPDDPLAAGDGCDNRVALWSDRYAERPLLIQGPGAGADVTSAALLDDVLDCVERDRQSR